MKSHMLKVNEVQGELTKKEPLASEELLDLGNSPSGRMVDRARSGVSGILGLVLGLKTYQAPVTIGASPMSCPR